MSMRARKVEVGVSLPLRFTLDPSLFPLLFFPQQVFFVVPRINQIEEAWQQISRCVPDARVAVGHSKVSEMTFLSGAQLFAHGRPAMLMGPGLGRCVAREDAERPLAPLLNFFATQTITIAGKKSGRRGSAVHAGQRRRLAGDVHHRKRYRHAQRELHRSDGEAGFSRFVSAIMPSFFELHLRGCLIFRACCSTVDVYVRGKSSPQFRFLDS